MSYWKAQSCYTCEYRVGTRCRLNPPGGMSANDYPMIGNEEQDFVEQPSELHNGVLYAPACSRYRVNEVQLCEKIKSTMRDIDLFSESLARSSQ